MTPRQRVVQNHDWSSAFEGQEQDPRFTGTKICDQANDMLARWSTQIDPRQRFRNWQIETSTPALGKLFGNGGRNDNPRDQFWQQLQLSDLVKILER